MQNPILIVMICIVLIMLLSRIRIVRVPNKKQDDLEKHFSSDENSELVITGYMDVLRDNYPTMSDVQILLESQTKFTSVFESALEMFGDDKSKLSEMFDIQVFFDLADRNLLVSKAVAKTERAKQIMGYMGKTLNKVKKDFS